MEHPRCAETLVCLGRLAEGTQARPTLPERTAQVDTGLRIVGLDARDEAELSAVERLLAAWRERGDGPALVAVVAPPDAPADAHRARLARWARAWQVPVVDLPADGVDELPRLAAALDGALASPGLVGFQAGDRTALLTGPAVARFHTEYFDPRFADWTVGRPLAETLAGATRVLACVECTASLSIVRLTLMCRGILDAAPGAEALFPCPFGQTPRLSVLALSAA